METLTIILIILLFIISTISLVLIFALLKKKSAGGVSEAYVEKENKRMVEEISRAMGLSNTTVFDGVTKMSEMNERRVLELQESVKKSLTEMREDNSKRLAEMREVVDMKLRDTINDKFNESFVMISKRLEDVSTKLGEVQVLSNGVTDLKKLMTNVKTRGVWGEVMLQGLLEEFLHPTQFCSQYKITRSEDSIVDFVVVLPGSSEGENVLLPIDSKFPVEDYVRLQEAADRGDQEEVAICLKSLKRSVSVQAKSIRDKYIKVPKTTDFAIMYLPSEGLYSEIARDNDLVTSLRKDKIMPAGPTTLAALLNSLKLGFETLAIQKSNAEILKIFLEIRKYMSDFNAGLDDINTSLERVSKTIEKAKHKGDQIEKRIRKVDFPGTIDGETGGDK